MDADILRSQSVASHVVVASFNRIFTGDGFLFHKNLAQAVVLIKEKVAATEQICHRLKLLPQ